jgi:threonine/homoserine/homoserine lactone efflux protein
MDVNDVGGYIGVFSEIIGWLTTGLSKIVNALFSVRNLFFFVLIAGIIYLVYFAWKQETLKRRYYFNRRREI